MPMPRKAGFFYRLFNDLYEVKIYQKNGPARVFYMQSIRKLTNTEFRGVDENGEKIEYKSTEPFDYFKRRLY
jgi:hypothetical protein